MLSPGEAVFADMLAQLKPTTPMLQFVDVLQDLGFYTWSVPQVKDLRATGANKVISGVVLEGKPEKMVPKHQIPFPIKMYRPRELPKNSARMNVFPNHVSPIVATWVANQRGIEPKTCHFVLGGSTLGFFATQKNPSKANRYLIQKHEGTIYVQKTHIFTQDYTGVPFQFERLLTGIPMAHKHPEQTEHLQLLRLFDKWTVLCSAEADGMDEVGNTVEIKSKKESGTKLLFQMVSNGSCYVVSGVFAGKFNLVGTETTSLAEIAQEISPVFVECSADRIKTALELLEQAELQPTRVYSLHFEDSAGENSKRPVLTDLTGSREFPPFLPNSAVLSKLFP
eukprot:TRINITY_DN19152_c0_g1_i1.p1 TRINITY_DN19152_c0_g1~~TRINITY_DN19152_c0_g1_i1.p1  ORF type:complete len:338 (-),score=13.08 TRINITY_DN19152_c0_g1_i1:43-1056(-)